MIFISDISFSLFPIILIHYLIKDRNIKYKFTFENVNELYEIVLNESNTLLLNKKLLKFYFCFIA